MGKKKKRYIISAILVIVIIIILLCLRSCQRDSPLSENEETSTEQESKSLDFIPADESQDTISIPAVSGINMVAGQLDQTVDFYNPTENNCYFQISLYLSDDTLLYQSDYIKPTEHIQYITLNQELKKGMYIPKPQNTLHGDCEQAFR